LIPGLTSAEAAEGKRSAVREELLQKLLTLDEIPAHHSHPCRRFAVVVRGNGAEIDLDLARDSKRPQEYWVFFPKHSFTDYNEIGRIRTPLLDAVPSSGTDKPRRERAR